MLFPRFSHEQAMLKRAMLTYSFEIRLKLNCKTFKNENPLTLNGRRPLGRPRLLEPEIAAARR